MKPCPNIIAIVESSKIQNMKEILNLIHVGKSVVEKEDLIVPILVLNFVIKENANLANTKELSFPANVEKVQE